MTLRPLRIVLTAFAAEALSIALLVLVVALFGPHERAQDAAFAERVGQWLGPLSGLVLCALGGYFVARPLAGGQVLHGALLGLAAAAIDLALLVLGGAPFQLLFVLSNLGRVLAGCAGGWIAARQPAAAPRKSAG